MTVSKKAQKKGWTELYEDTPGGRYMRPLTDPSYRYLFVEVTDMDDACGRDNEGQPKFVWEAKLVDLNQTNKTEEKRALDCCGCDLDSIPRAQQAIAIADCLVSYGTAALLDSGTADRFERARAQGIAAADLAVASEDNLNNALDRSFNAIGTTGHDMLKGDLLAGLHRSAEKVMNGETVEQNAQIMLRMFAAAGGQTLGAGVEIDLAIAGVEIDLAIAGEMIKGK